MNKAIKVGGGQDLPVACGASALEKNWDDVGVEAVWCGMNLVCPVNWGEQYLQTTG